MTKASRTIAILDDEKSVRTAFRRLLRAGGYDVVLFETGTDLLASHRAQPFGCILLDLHMPEMSGFDVLSHLASMETNPPVVAITGHDQGGNRERLTRLGVRQYFVKPVDKIALFEAIESVLAGTTDDREPDSSTKVE